jgi:hypothetical protein
MTVDVKTEVKAPGDAGHQGTYVDKPTYGLVLTVFLAVAGIALLLRLGIAMQRSLETKERTAELELASFVLFVFAAIGLAGHVLFVPIDAGETWQPVFDLTTLAWALLIGVSFVVPIATEFSAGGVSVKLATVRKAAAVTFSATKLLRTWMSEIDSSLDAKRTFELPSQANAWLAKLWDDYVSLRASETVQWIGSDVERRRLSVWLLLPEQGGPRTARGEPVCTRAAYWASNEFKGQAPQPFRFLAGDGVTALREGGIVGYVARTQRAVNVADATRHPKFVSRPGSDCFRGLYVTPITRYKGTPKAQPLGLLVIDRQKAEAFNSEAVNILEALAEHLAVLIDPRSGGKVG